jgi:hypothetical protein
MATAYGTVGRGVKQVIEQILIANNGEITASELVDAARPVDSPAHPGFEWDDAIAGEEYRRYQARHWMRNLMVISNVVQPTPSTIGVPQPIRLVHVPNVGGQGEGKYRPLNLLPRIPDEYDRAMDEAKIKLLGAKVAMYDLISVAEKKGKDRTVLCEITQCMDNLAAALAKL